MSCPYRGIASSHSGLTQWYYCAAPTRTEKQFEKMWQGRRYPDEMGGDCIDDETCPVARQAVERARKGEEAYAKAASKYKTSKEIPDEYLWE